MSVPGEVLFLDDDDDLRETVADALTGVGVPSFTVGTFAELRQHADRALSCRLAILDVNLGTSQTGVDAYEWLRRLGFRGMVVFLTGHAKDYPAVAAASRIGDARVVEKPISLATLRTLVEEGSRASA
jgi:DNA-binding NtrC family response regulator